MYSYEQMVTPCQEGCEPIARNWRLMLAAERIGGVNLGRPDLIWTVAPY